MTKANTETPDVTILVLGDVNFDTIYLTPKKSGELSDELSRNVSSSHLRIRRPGGTLLLRNVIKEAIWYTPPQGGTSASQTDDMDQTDDMEKIPDKPPVEMEKNYPDNGASVWDFRLKYDLHKFKLDLESSVSSPGNISKNSENLIFVANEGTAGQDLLYFRILGRYGEKVEARETDDNLKNKEKEITELKEKLRPLLV